MIRRPPRSTLFPYPPLFRSRPQLRPRALPPQAVELLQSRLPRQPVLGEQAADRSEEHTSELQSPCNLVCRLLLEKKKKTDTNIHVRFHYKNKTEARDSRR